jgi:alpha-tubulin suppressor-like RCC1 family protein
VTGGLRFSQVSAGGFYTCGVSTDQAAYCWGNNFGGPLGDGTTTDRNAPVPVAAPQ